MKNKKLKKLHDFWICQRYGWLYNPIEFAKDLLCWALVFFVLLVLGLGLKGVWELKDIF